MQDSRLANLDGLRRARTKSSAPTPTYSTQLVQIEVKNICVAADIGVFHHEIGRRQRLHIDVRADLRPPLDDTLARTLDYNRVVAFSEQLAETRINLIETFAGRLADLCLGEENVHRVEIMVTKPAALTNGTPAVRLVRQLDRSGADDPPTA